MRVFICTLILILPIITLGQLKEGLNNSTICITSAPQEKFDVKAIIWIPPAFNPGKKYPLVIYGHGAAQAGNDLDLLYSDGLPAVLKGGYEPPFDCIIICPQRQSYGVSPDWLPGMLEDARRRFNIDTTRIYLTGTSAGGYLCYGGLLNVSGDMAKKIAAICVISGATQDANQDNIGWWVTSKTPLWAIIGSEDHTFARQNIFLTNLINQRVPGTAKLSIRVGAGHGGWLDVYDGTFMESGKNIWSWLYGFKTGPVPRPSKSPVKKRIDLVVNDRQVYSINVAGDYNPQPGDTLVVPTGVLSFSLQNFAGTKKSPIIIIPKDSGWIGGYAAFAAAISKAKFFKLTGFRIDGIKKSVLGIAIGYQTTDYEISHCFIKNISSIGLLAKQDPDSLLPHCSWPGFSIRNVSINHIVVRNVGTEGLYLGYTFDVVKPLASPFINLQVHNIRVDSTGWDGVQLSNCQEVSLHDIEVRNYGLKNESGQQAGVLLGGMVTLQSPATDIRVTNGTGPGLLIFGRGLMRLKNIRLTNVGMSPGQNAIFVNDYKDLGYTLPPLQLFIANTTVNGSLGNALVIMNENKSMKPGKIENFSFSHTLSGIRDSDNILQSKGHN